MAKLYIENFVNKRQAEPSIGSIFTSIDVFHANVSSESVSFGYSLDEYLREQKIPHISQSHKRRRPNNTHMRPSDSHMCREREKGMANVESLCVLELFLDPSQLTLRRHLIWLFVANAVQEVTKMKRFLFFFFVNIRTTTST